MYESYDFFTAPNFGSFDTVSREYEESFKTLLKTQREAYLKNEALSVADALAVFTNERRMSTERKGQID